MFDCYLGDLLALKPGRSWSANSRVSWKECALNEAIQALSTDDMYYHHYKNAVEVITS